jgi:hypothetical protein
VAAPVRRVRQIPALAKGECAILTSFQCEQIAAIPDADLQREAASAIRLAHRSPRDLLAQEWRNRLWLECTYRCRGDVWESSLAEVQREIDAERAANAAAITETKGR